MSPRPATVLREPPPRLTPALKRGLEILAQAGDLRPRSFALAMWPESPGHLRIYRPGDGPGRRGARMGQVGAALLWRLRRLGYASRLGGSFKISPAGAAVLTGELVCWPAPRGPTCRRCKQPRHDHHTDGRTTWCPESNP